MMGSSSAMCGGKEREEGEEERKEGKGEGEWREKGERKGEKDGGREEGGRDRRRIIMTGFGHNLPHSQAI